MQRLRELIEVARGEREPDVVLTGKILSVFTGEVIEGDVAIYGNRIAGIGEYGGKRVETDGVILPGFMDAHMHLESTLLSPSEFAKAVLPHGTTSVFIDPHEIANVSGTKGIEYIYNSTRNLPVNFFLTVPSCVPAIKGFETYGAELKSEEISEILQWEGVVGLAEMMNFPGVIYGDENVLKKIEVASHKVIDGHSPGLMGNQLNAYISAGIISDHECITAEEAVEKVRRGMKIMIREGSVAKNLSELIKIVNESNLENFMLASDDFLPIDIEKGHMDYRLKLCVENGIKPELAVKMTTINTARYFRLYNFGAIAPGYIADIVIVDNLNSFNVKMVIKDGKVVWDGKLRVDFVSSNPPQEILNSVKVPEIEENDLKIEAESRKVRVIELIPGQILTKKVEVELIPENGFFVPDGERDIAKIVVVDRHGKGKKIGKGFVKGFGLKKGAMASSVSHDSHNCVCVGMEDRDILAAIKRIEEMQGGFVVADGGVVAELPLPIAGLMSDLPWEEVKERLEKLHEVLKELGVEIGHPFTALSFLSLPVIPELKITDFGLIDVNIMSFVDLWVAE